MGSQPHKGSGTCDTEHFIPGHVRHTSSPQPRLTQHPLLSGQASRPSFSIPKADMGSKRVFSEKRRSHVSRNCACIAVLEAEVV